GLKLLPKTPCAYLDLRLDPASIAHLPRQLHAHRSVSVAAIVAKHSQAPARHAEDDVGVAVAVQVRCGEHSRTRERRTLFRVNQRPDAARGPIAHVHPAVADVAPDVKLRM